MSRPLLAPQYEEPSADEMEQIRHDLAIHEAVESILRLYKTVGKESAHWICTSAIIAGEREAARNANG